MDNEEIGKYAGMLPSRAMLARLSLFGTDEETRNSANAILKALPPMNERERREYLDETWRLAGLSEAEMELSPIGAATLEMFRGDPPVGDGVVGTDAISTPESPATKEPEASPPQLPDDGVNDYLKKLDWPPKPSPTPKAPVDEQPHKWVAGTPSTPSKDQTPVSDWNSDSNNNPIY